MSFYNNPLADILNALAASSAEQSTRPSGQFGRRFPGQQQQQFYYDPNEYTGQDDDEDDEDDDIGDDGYSYYGYPGFYPQPFFGGNTGYYPQPQPQQQYTPAQFAAQFGGPVRSRFRQSGSNNNNNPRQAFQSPQPPSAGPSTTNLRRASHSSRPISRVSSQQRLNSQSQPLEVNDILDYLTTGRGRKPSDAGADLDADLAAALRKEMEAKEGRDPESTILESLKEDIEHQENDDDDKLTFPAPSGGPTDTSGKLETPKQSKPTINVNPLARRHSSLRTFKDPQPKIEVSQRNTKNPKLPYSPSINVYDTKDEYNVVLALPGASLNEIDIDFHPATNEIVIKGSINSISNLNEIDLKHSEIRTGSIERRVKFPTLPKIIDENIKAKYLNGLLTIKVPKESNDDVLKKPKRKVTIEDVPDEELEYEAHGGYKEVEQDK